MSEPTETIPQLHVETITEIAKRNQPDMERMSTQAKAAMAEVTEINEDFSVEYVNGLLVNVRSAYDRIRAKRMEITKVIDEAKDKLMDYERPLSPEDKKSEYMRLRDLLVADQQKKLDDKKRVEDEAAKKKARENALVEIGATILTSLTDLVTKKATETEALSSEYFKKTTLENFDKRAEAYNAMKPNLKKEEYEGCFTPLLRSTHASLFSVGEMTDILNTIMSEEPFEKWNKHLVEVATPTINAWRAKIPELKQNLINLKNASDTEERERILKEQQAKETAEAERRRQDIEQLRVDQNSTITEQANLEKLNNAFVEQAVIQQADETGATQLVLKFTDPKQVVKALSTMIYHCMMNKDFPGIGKRDKSKNEVFDKQGRPEYIDAVQWWIDFFLKKCKDVHVEGTQVYEVPKVTVRK